jgi:hypothetical protein
MLTGATVIASRLALALSGEPARVEMSTTSSIRATPAIRKPSAVRVLRILIASPRIRLITWRPPRP